MDFAVKIRFGGGTFLLLVDLCLSIHVIVWRRNTINVSYG